MAVIDVTLNNSTALGGQDKPPLEVGRAEPSRAESFLVERPCLPPLPDVFPKSAASPRLASQVTVALSAD